MNEDQNQNSLSLSMSYTSDTDDSDSSTASSESTSSSNKSIGPTNIPSNFTNNDPKLQAVQYDEFKISNTVDADAEVNANVNVNVKNDTKTDENDNGNYSSLTANQSFQEFFEREDLDSHKQIEEMTEIERQRQLNDLLNEEDSDAASLHDVNLGFGGAIANANTNASADMNADVAVNGHTEKASLSLSVSDGTDEGHLGDNGSDDDTKATGGVTKKYDSNEHEMAVDLTGLQDEIIPGHEQNDEEKEQHENTTKSKDINASQNDSGEKEHLESSDSSSFASSAGSSSVSTASFHPEEKGEQSEDEHHHGRDPLNQEEDQEGQDQLSIPIAISTSRSMEQQISEFDRAMTDVIHSAYGEAHKGGTVSYSNAANEDANELNNSQSPIGSPLSDTVQQVRTMDEEEDEIEAALVETCLSLSKSREEEEQSNIGSGSGAGSGSGSGSGVTSDKISVALGGTPGALNKGEAVASASVISTSTTKSLAQQIKQSIGKTPLKPLPRTVVPNIITNPSSPTMRHASSTPMSTTIRPKSNNIASGKLPDVLTTVRHKIDGLFENDRKKSERKDEDEQAQQNRENLKRAFQQSVNAAVLVSLAHKRYERRRLAAMEIEKVVRTLVQSRELDRVKGILILLSDDYVRSTNEDARKGGVVAMAACAIGLKKAHDMPGLSEKTNECTDLILASVVHACQDHSQRVRYYATESLFNVVKVLPSLAVDHFFILFEILRSLWADVDVDVRSGAELLDKKLQGIIIGSVNSGQFEADACIPLFARFLHMRNKPTKRLTLTWLQAFAENLIGAPLLEFLHLFLYDVFAMLADPNTTIRQLALLFLNSMLPKLLMKNEDFEDSGETYNKVDFDKILQSLVTTMEHPDPFVRKVAMFWVSRIVQAHMGVEKLRDSKRNESGGSSSSTSGRSHSNHASASVINALEHVLPGLLLSIGDTFQSRSAAKDTFLPDQTTHYLADQTNRCLQKNVRHDGRAYIPHLGGFIVALREELDTKGGLSGKNRSAKERKPYRMDVKPDGTGIESTGWFRNYDEESENVEGTTGHENILSRLCALEWIVLLFEFVVPDSLKDEYAEEFIAPVIRLLDDAPEVIVLKSLEILSKITVSKSAEFDKLPALSASSSKNVIFQKQSKDTGSDDTLQTHPMTDDNATFALGVLSLEDKGRLSRNRDVFAALIKAKAKHPSSLDSLSRIVRHMCALQPPEFVFVSFGLELNLFVLKMMSNRAKLETTEGHDSKKLRNEDIKISKHFEFATKFVQVLSNVLLTANETIRLRQLLKGCIASAENTTRNERKAQMFHILLKTFAHDPIAAISLCLWCGAFRTAASYIHKIDPLDLNLSFFMELDQLIEFIERPLFRDLHLTMLECNENPALEGSGAMLYRALKSILMLLPQSRSYKILQQRLLSVARFRQCAVHLHGMSHVEIRGTSAEIFVHRILEVRQLHCNARWRSIRSESLEPSHLIELEGVDVDGGRRSWLGYANKEEEEKGREKYRNNHDGGVEEDAPYTQYQEFHKEKEIPPDDRNDLAEEEQKDEDHAVRQFRRRRWQRVETILGQ